MLEITLAWDWNKVWREQSGWNFYQKCISSRPLIGDCWERMREMEWFPMILFNEGDGRHHTPWIPAKWTQKRRFIYVEGREMKEREREISSVKTREEDRHRGIVTKKWILISDDIMKNGEGKNEEAKIDRGVALNTTHYWKFQIDRTNGSEKSFLIGGGGRAGSNTGSSNFEIDHFSMFCMPLCSPWNSASNDIWQWRFYFVRTIYYNTKVGKSGFSYRDSLNFWLGFTKPFRNHYHLRTQSRYLADKSMGKNSNTIEWLLEELLCKRPARLTDFRVYSLFEYTKIFSYEFQTYSLLKIQSDVTGS